MMGKRLARVRKAIAGGFVAAIPLLFPMLSDGHLDPTEVGALVAAFLAGGGVVFGIPNAPKPPSNG